MGCEMMNQGFFLWLFFWGFALFLGLRWERGESDAIGFLWGFLLFLRLRWVDKVNRL